MWKVRPILKVIRFYVILKKFIYFYYQKSSPISCCDIIIIEVSQSATFYETEIFLPQIVSSFR